MKTEPTALQRLLMGATGLVVSVTLALWLGLSYFGVMTGDTKVSVQVDQLGDAIGPGAKVRYHGIIVGRVLRLAEHGTGYRLHILVDDEHSRSIPSSATARILPSTVFGSEYVELLADRDATAGDHLMAGNVIAADRSEATMRLMTSFDEAERLISAVDAEDINRITGKLAPALDGHGEDIKDFLERADGVVTDINDDLPTTWETLRLAVVALGTLADIEPDLTSAMDHAQVTTDTIVDQDKQIGKVLDGSTEVVEGADNLLTGVREILVPFVQRLERLTGLAADNAPAVQQIINRFAQTANNGAAGVDDNAIQMIGTIGLDLLPTYTAADCTRYGPTLVALNCGDAVQAGSAADVSDDASWMDAVADRIADLLSTGPGVPASGDEDATGSAQSAPDAATPTPSPGGLLELIGGLGATLGGRDR